MIFLNLNLNFQKSLFTMLNALKGVIVIFSVSVYLMDNIAKMYYYTSNRTWALIDFKQQLFHQINLTAIFAVFT